MQELLNGDDFTREVSPEELAKADQMQFSHLEAKLQEYNFYIIARPTPIDKHKRPDLRPLQGASTLVGRKHCPGK